MAEGERQGGFSENPLGAETERKTGPRTAKARLEDGGRESVSFTLNVPRACELPRLVDAAGPLRGTQGAQDVPALCARVLREVDAGEAPVAQDQVGAVSRVVGGRSEDGERAGHKVGLDARVCQEAEGEAMVARVEEEEGLCREAEGDGEDEVEGEVTGQRGAREGQGEVVQARAGDWGRAGAGEAA